MELQRHPIRGALYGLLIGLMLAYFVFFRFTMFGFDSLGSVITKFVIVVLIGVAIGVAFAYLAPPKGAKPPAAAPAAPIADEPAPVAEPERATPAAVPMAHVAESATDEDEPMTDEDDPGFDDEAE